MVKGQIVILAVSIAILALSFVTLQSDHPANRTLISFFSAVLPAADADYAELLRALDEFADSSITPEPDRFVMGVVENTIRSYDQDKEGTLERITAMEADFSEYPFVIDLATRKIVAHGALPELVGMPSLIFSDDADRPSDVVVAELLEGGEGTGTWVEYLFFDVNLDTDQLKRSWIVLHDGYIFGAGHYFPAELRVKHEVNKAIFMYDFQKDLAFDYINSLADTPYPHYVAVMNIKSAEVKAHGAFPDEAVGTKVSKSREGLTDLEYGDTFWLYVQNKNPMTGLVDQKRVWVVEHDGHYFASGYYYYAEDKSRFVVDRTVDLYNELGSEYAFAHITSLESNDPQYPFIINPATGKIVAHGAFPHLIGTDSVILTDRTERTTADILADLAINENTWTDYKFQNPRTDELEHKKTYLRLHDEYIFGSGFYYTTFGVSEDP